MNHKDRTWETFLTLEHNALPRVECIQNWLDSEGSFIILLKDASAADLSVEQAAEPESLEYLEEASHIVK